jgi:hypothetical protein
MHDTQSQGDVGGEPGSGRAITLRAVLLGLLVVVFVNAGSPLAEALAFSNFSWSYLPEGGVAPFLLLLVINMAVRRWLPRGALTRGELLTVFVMGLVSNCTPIFLMFFHLSAIVSPLYFTSPENQWSTLLLPHLPRDLIVNNRDAVRWFYEGLPTGHAIPWGAWLIPLSRWAPFLLSLLFSSYALVVLFRRPWREHERLSYPLMQLPLLMVEGRTGPGEPPIARCAWFWIGLALPFGATTLYVLHSAFPTLPAPALDHIGSLRFGMLPISQRTPWIQVDLTLNFLALGVGYFVPSQILLSIWVFYLFRLFEEMAISILGIDLGSGGMFTWGNSCTAWQSGGAFFVLGLSAIYAARRHIVTSIQQAIRDDPDADEMLSPRMTWGVLTGSLLFMSVWLHHYLMPLGVIALFLPAVLLIYLGVARVICEAGVFYFVPPLIAQNLTIYTLGSRFIGPNGMFALGLTYSWHGDVQTVLPGLASQCFRLKDPMGCRGRHFSLITLLTVVVGLFTAAFAIITLGYTHRAMSWNTWVYQGWGPSTYGQVLHQVQNPFDSSLPHLLWFAAGALLTAALVWGRLHIEWFPLHPIGLAVVSSFTIGVAVWFACLVAWVVKSGALLPGPCRRPFRGPGPGAARRHGVRGQAAVVRRLYGKPVLSVQTNNASLGHSLKPAHAVLIWEAAT